MPDVNEAAERLRKGVYGLPLFNPLHMLSQQLMEDLCTVRDSYIAEHPADDGGLIDESWLQSVGAEKQDHPAKWTFHREDALSIGLWIVDDGWKVMLLHTPHAASCIVRGLKSRGDVRRLCSALGIDLKEPA